MRSYRDKMHIVLEPGIFIIAAMALLLLPLRWLCAALFSILIHEASHILMIRFCGGEILACRFSLTGAQIQTQPMTLPQELLCAAAGPLGGLSVLLLGRFLPRLAFCAGVHSLYNLLPIYPLDGGRILRCASRLLLPERFAAWLCIAAENLCLIGIGVLGLWGTFVWKLGVIPALLGGILIIRVRNRKIPCKEA